MKRLEERIKKMTDVLRQAIVKETVELTALYKKTDFYEGGILPNPSEFVPLPENRSWASKFDEHAWFYLDVDVPVARDGERITFCMECEPGVHANPQSIVYVNGALVSGFDCNHREIELNEPGKCEIMIYACSGAPRDFPTRFPMISNFYIKRLDVKTEKLYYDLLAPLQVVGYTQEYEKEYADIIGVLNHALNLVDFREFYSEAYEASLVQASEYLRKNLYGEYYANNATVVGIGHTHIDIAWLWRYRFTREKAVHSFAIVLYLMDKYPEYKFMSSQAILYEIVKEDAPLLYEKIKQRVKEGRWEVEGAMYLEADCNLTSGESLVRQILYGKNFFRREFNVDSKVLWLPDVFGYSAAMPQILRRSGVETFVTSKISWNDTNQIPYDTFNWYGIDGTPVFSYFLTAQDRYKDKKPVKYSTYVSFTDMPHIAGTWDRYQQKELNDEAILTFGFGDGGGGTTDEMLEKMRRASMGLPNAPKAKIGTVTDFIAHLKGNCKGKRIPEIIGELYLEFHRGTYTNIAKNKRNNRKGEFALQNAETYSVIAEVLGASGYADNALHDAWKLLLKNQFHDILPGSSINAVYDDSDLDYEAIQTTANNAIEGSCDALLQKIQTDKAYVAFNPTPYAFSGNVTIDGMTHYIEHIPPKGYKAVDLLPCEGDVQVTEKTLENRYYKIVFDDSYRIVSLFDKKNGREVLKNGRVGNVLEAHEDYPGGNYDGWELRSYHDQKVWYLDEVQEVRLLDDDAKKGIWIKRDFSKSSVEQTIWLYPDTDRIDFETVADWHNEHICLKVAFPIAVNTTKATYDIQFGNVERATTRNNSWESAKFEVCAHKFADLSESDYGVALLNDCKYGYETYGSEIKLTLLRCAMYPNPSGDKGKHVFTYSLRTHENDLRNSDIYKTAYQLNNPVLLKKATKNSGGLPETYSFVCASKENILIDSVKKTENGNGYVIRAFESQNKTTECTFTFGNDWETVYESDLMENKEQQLEMNGKNVTVKFKPFEIKTLIVES